MAYQKTEWVDFQEPYINAEHLNNIEGGIEGNETLINELFDKLKTKLYTPADKITLGEDVEFYTNDGTILRTGNVVQLCVVFKNTVEIPAGTTKLLGNIHDIALRTKRSFNFVAQGSGTNRFLVQVDSNGNIRASRYSNTTNNQPMLVGSWLNVNATYIVGD